MKAIKFADDSLASRTVKFVKVGSKKSELAEKIERDASVVHVVIIVMGYSNKKSFCSRF